MRIALLAMTILFFTAIASANEPLWTESERTDKRDVVIDGEVLSVEKLHEVNKQRDLYVTKVKVLKTHKSQGDLRATIPVYFEFSKTGKNTRCPAYVELKKGDKGKFFLWECGPDLKKRLKIDKLKGVLFLEMRSDVIKEEETLNKSLMNCQE